jgi:hypothetical protein
MYKCKWFVLIISKNLNVCSFENNKKKYEDIFKIGLKIYFEKNTEMVESVQKCYGQAA